MFVERIDWRSLHKRSRLRQLTPPESKGEGEDIVVHTDSQQEDKQEEPMFRNPTIVGENILIDPQEVSGNRVENRE